MIVTNVATKQTDKGVAPQSPFEESATTSARWPVRNRVTVGVVSHPGSPFLSDFFVKKQMNSSQKPSKKWLQKKCDIKHQTDRIWPILSISGVVFWTAKTQIPFAKTSKTCPQNMTRNSLKNPVKGHLRLASVVALSSNGACGAKNPHHDLCSPLPSAKADRFSKQKMKN